MRPIIDNMRAPLFSSGGDKIRRPFCARCAILFSRPPVVPSFPFFFLHRRRLSLAFLAVTRPRDSPADNLRYDTWAVRSAPARLAESAKRYSPTCSSPPSLSRPKERARSPSLRLARSRERYFLETRTLCLPIRKAPEILDSLSPFASDS